MLSEKLKNGIIISVISGSILAAAGALYGTMIAIPRIEQKLDDKVELLDQAIAAVEKTGETKLNAERERSTVIDDFSTQWLKATSDRALDNSDRIKGLETSSGIHHNEVL